MLLGMCELMADGSLLALSRLFAPVVVHLCRPGLCLDCLPTLFAFDQLDGVVYAPPTRMLLRGTWTRKVC
jgi:hypothetical protein